MFQGIEAEATARFRGVRQTLSRSPRGVASPSAEMKGYVFVQIYAIYEYVVKSSVEATLQAFNQSNVRLSEVRLPLLSLCLHGELQSLQDCSSKKAWEKRHALFEAIGSSRTAVVDTALLPNLGDHFRHRDLQFVFEVFGVRGLPTRRRNHSFRINEVVLNRNQIAHGEVRAEEVGRNFSRQDINHRIDQMESVCRCIVARLSQHCGNTQNFMR